MNTLTVLYDASCPICVRCAHWLVEEPAYVAMELLPSSSEEALRRYGEVPWLGAELVVVWATLDKSAGRAAIKSFVVEKGTPGFELVRLEHKLGIRASDTAQFALVNCRVPKENLLGDPKIDVEKVCR